jgi:hypothetical protein
MIVPTLAEKIALELVARDGKPAVLQLHVLATRAYRDGHIRAAGVLLEIADAADRALTSRERNSKIKVSQESARPPSDVSERGRP